PRTEDLDLIRCVQPRACPRPRVAPRAGSLGGDRRNHQPAPAAVADRARRRPDLSALDWEIEPVAPVGPATVVDRHVVLPDQRQDERDLGRADPGAVVADQPLASAHAGLLDLRPEVVAVTEAL